MKTCLATRYLIELDVVPKIDMATNRLVDGEARFQFRVFERLEKDELRLVLLNPGDHPILSSYTAENREDLVVAIELMTRPQFYETAP